VDCVTVVLDQFVFLFDVLMNDLLMFLQTREGTRELY